jgi:Fe-S-cluster-containing hydrogenase component 2
MQHSASLEDKVGILQQMLGVDRTEVALPRSEHHGNNVKRHLVHQTKLEGLTADVACRHCDGAFPGELGCACDCPRPISVLMFGGRPSRSSA